VASISEINTDCRDLRTVKDIPEFMAGRGARSRAPRARISRAGDPPVGALGGGEPDPVMARSPRGVRASFVGAPTRSAIRLSCNGQCNVGHATLATSSAPRLGALGAAAHASRMRRRRQKRRQAWLICGNISAIVPFRRHASPAAPNHGRTAGQAGKLREVRRVRSLGGYGRSQRCEGARAPLRRNARAAAALAWKISS
jgi:hypothetical protein